MDWFERLLDSSTLSPHAVVHQGRLDSGVALLQKPLNQAMFGARIREVLDRP